jgi:hypothetical protein
LVTFSPDSLAVAERNSGNWGLLFAVGFLVSIRSRAFRIYPHNAGGANSWIYDDLKNIRKCRSSDRASLKNCNVYNGFSAVFVKIRRVKS